MVLGSISARDVEDVDTKPKAAKNLLIQPLEKKNIGVLKMQMIILQLMSQQKQKCKMRMRMSQYLMLSSSKCHHQRNHHMKHLHKQV